jgi:hypothetical protein
MDDEGFGDATVVNPVAHVAPTQRTNAVGVLLQHQPVEGDGRATATVLITVRKMDNNGAIICSTATLRTHPPK